MRSEKSEWYYGDEKSGQWKGPITLAQLDELYSLGTIEDHTRVVNAQMLRYEGSMAHGHFYSNLARINVLFSPEPEAFVENRQHNATTVLSGPNNCGKTLFLKHIYSAIGQGAYLIGCNRFSHVDVLNTREMDKHHHRTYYDNFVNEFYSSRQNTENNHLNLQEIITGLKDGARKKLFAVAENLLGNTFALQRTDPENTFSPFYVDVDGENLRYASTGTRLLLTLLGTMLDDRFSVLLIDEPEIGLSPRIQSALATFLYDQRRRQEFSPHLDRVFVATHSHLMLDRDVISNNFVVNKNAADIDVSQLSSPAGFHQLQFNLLGNDLEALFLPSSIVLVEGESDASYLKKLVQLRIPNKRITIVRAGGDGEIQSKINFVREAFGDITTSPYGGRFFAVLDATHSIKISRLHGQGLAEENVVVWSRNGIEYYYPKILVAEAFHCDESDVVGLDFSTDPIKHNGFRYSKKQLAEFVCDRISPHHELPDELVDLLDRIARASGN